MSNPQLNENALDEALTSVVDFTIKYGAKGVFCWDEAKPDVIWISDNIRAELATALDHHNSPFFKLSTFFDRNTVAFFKVLAGKTKIDLSAFTELKTNVSNATFKNKTFRLIGHLVAGGKSRKHYLAVDTFLGTKYYQDSLGERIKEAEDLAEMGYWEYRLSDKQIFWSEAVYKIFGRSPSGPIYNTDFLEFIHPEDRDLVRQSFDKASKVDGDYHVIHRIILPDGSIRFLEERAHLKNPDGSLAEIISGTVQDITAIQKEKLAFESGYSFYRSMLDGSPIPHGLNTSAGKVLYLNPEFVNCFGYSLKDLPSMHDWWSKAFPNADERRVIQSRWKSEIKKAKTLPNYQMVVIAQVTCKNNTQKHVLIRSSLVSVPMQDKTYLVTFQDLTQLKEAEIKFLNSERRFSKIFTESPLPFLLVNTDTVRVEQVNHAWLRLFKLSKRSVVKESFTMLPIWKEAYLNTFKGVFEDNQQINGVEMVLQDSESESVFCAISVIPIQNLGSNTILFLFEDIGARKKSELQLQLSEARFKDIAKFNQAVVWEMDPTGLFTYVGPPSKEIWGYAPEELIGKVRFFDLHPEEGREAFRQQTIQMVIEGGTIRDYINRICKPDGSVIYVSTNGGPVFDQTGNVIAYRGSDSDITEKVLAQHAAFEVQQRLEKLTREVPGAVCQFSINGVGNLAFPFLTDSFFTLFEIDKGLGHESIEPQFLKRIIPEDSSRFKTVLKASADSLEILKIDFRVQLPLRGLIWVSLSARPERLSSEEIIWNGIFIDVTQRMDDELQLTKLSEAVRQSSAAVVITDYEGTIEYVNPKFEEVTGYHHDEVVGAHPRILKSGEQSNAFYKNLWETIVSGETWKGEFVNKKKNGDLYWEAATISPVRNEIGDITNFIAVKEDITYKKAAEKQLKLSQERYRSIIEISNVGAWEYDFTTKHLWCSENYFSMLGKSSKEFAWLNQPNLKEVWLDLIHPEDVEKSAKRFYDYLKDPTGTYENTFRLLKSDGSIVWIWSRGKMLHSTDNKRSVLGAHIEITEQVLSRQKAEERADYLNSLFRTIPDMLFIMSKEGVFIEFKSNDNDLLTTPHDFLGKHFEAVLPTELAEKHAKAAKEAFETNSVSEYQYELTVDNSQRAFRARIVPFGREKLIVLVANISKEVEYISRIERLLHVEEQQNKRLRNFTHIVSHNLRSHSANINGIFEFLKIDEPQFFTNDYMNMLFESTQNLHETINYLNEVLAINTEGHELLVKAMNIFQVVENASKTIQLLAKKADITIVNAVPKNIEVTVIPAYFESIVLNMLTNGIKFRREEAESFIQITASQSDAVTTIQFIDNGKGIDLDRHRNKLFGMYKTFHNHPESKGLGLFITKNHVEVMGGSIDVESEVGLGTTFTVSLPIKQPRIKQDY